jgi:predicted nucleotidyltransferase
MYKGIYTSTNASDSGDVSMVKSNAEIEKILKHFLEEVQQKYQIVSAYLYGSFARGTSNKWSDIDVAIISPDFSDDLFEERLKLMKLAASIDDRIEPKLFKKELFDPNDPLVDEIQKYGIQVL